MIVGDGLFSSHKGDKLNLFMKLFDGWRSEIPRGVPEVSKKLIDDCWSVKFRSREASEFWRYQEENGANPI
jgi:hypothetical protein